MNDGVGAFLDWSPELCSCQVFELQGLSLHGDPIYRPLPGSYEHVGEELPYDPRPVRIERPEK